MAGDDDADSEIQESRDLDAGGPPLTKSQRRRRARARRHQARDRVAARTDRTDCPRPDKPAYDKTDPAERRLQERALGVGMNMYDCRCGFSHNGTPTARDERTKAPLTLRLLQVDT